MTWTVLAALAGAFVTATLGALAIVREQSVIRQLERITAILKDTPDTVQGRANVEWVRDDLARRLNFQYRAPRQGSNLFIGWLGVLFGTGVLILVYAGLVFTGIAMALSGEAKTLPAWISVTEVVVVAAIAIVLLRTGYGFLRRRARQRLRWVIRHPDWSAARYF